MRGRNFRAGIERSTLAERLSGLLPSLAFGRGRMRCFRLAPTGSLG